MADKLLVAEDLKKVYGATVKTVAVDGISFEIERGEFVSIVGQSGSGKSTLLNLVGLLDTPTEGRVEISGRDTSQADRKERAVLRNDLLGFVFQFHHLLPEFSVLENVLMPALIAAGKGHADDDEKERAVDVLHTLGLEGLEDKNANEISGGQKQRVAIARALMNQPPLVLADEPTGNLDTGNSDAVYELFRTINRDSGTAFLIVTHDRSTAQRTDRILEVVDGKLTQDVRSDYLDEGGRPAGAKQPPQSASSAPRDDGSS